MTEQEKQENQKTIVAFAAGLLIGGLLVWIFGGSPKTETPNTTTENGATSTVMTSENNGSANTEEATNTANEQMQAEKPTMQTGTGAANVADQKAGKSVALESATFPSDEGWIGVRDYVNGQLGGLLGVARFSKEQGLIPQEVTLQRATKDGQTYAIVFYSESGDRVFNLADDKQVGDIADTFTALDK
jgi:hypothetical protein